MEMAVGRYSPASDLTVFFILQPIFSVVKKMPAIFSTVQKITSFSFYRHLFDSNSNFECEKTCIAIKNLPVKRKYSHFFDCRKNYRQFFDDRKKLAAV